MRTQGKDASSVPTVAPTPPLEETNGGSTKHDSPPNGLRVRKGVRELAGEEGDEEFEQAVAQASREGTPVVTMFTAEWVK